MSHDPIWQPGEHSDPELQRLEDALRPLAYQPDWKALEHALEAEPAGQRPTGIAPWWLAAAAALIVGVAISVVWYAQTSSQGWALALLEGPVEIGRKRAMGGSLREGQTLTTNASARAQLDVGELGSVEVLPSTTIRLLRAQPRQQRMSLERGSIRAVITAPPRIFIVDTPAATAVDLGCAYKLDVDEQGGGYLRVTVGWVSFEALGRESFIPAGAACRTRKGWAPGTPFYQDSSSALQEALLDVDFSPDPASRLSARRTVLAEARARDALTLWHLLGRGNDAERAITFDRFVQLVQIPAGVTRQGVLQLDRAMLDQLWNALSLGPVTWWRLWRGPAPPSP